ncbi:MAG: SH3 domain-containing protein [Anaerolineales bacterium]|nr:SH3 domain-containing protein [Anaerolineales bacterium]MDW8278310.1 SH3 domain-containing protein [Anaerolineales bacterium]
MKKSLLWLFFLALLAGCAAPGSLPATPTIDVAAIRTAVMLTAIADVTKQAAAATPTPAFTATFTPEPTLTPTPTVAVTLQPVPGIANANLNVRSDPRRGGKNLGGVFFNQKISIAARNPESNWYYIVWPDSPTGYAWILASAVQIENTDLYRLPIAFYDNAGNLVLRPPLVWEIPGTPLPIPPVPQGDKVRPATVIAPANARVCPSVGCMVLTVLPPGQQISMTGRYGDNEWAQFDFPSGPNGKAWVARSALEPGPDGFSGLPRFDVLGMELTPEPPTSTPDPNVTPTITNTPRPTPAGPLARMEADAVIYAEPNSLSAQVGALKKGDEIYITGISLIGEWYQIQFPAFTEGRAYIPRKNVRVLGDMRRVPYFNEQGTPLPTP